MPTIVSHGAVELASPHFSRRPIGSSPGQYRRAMPSLTMTTLTRPSSSTGVNTRPRTSGMPSVLK
jgi:hypothetical protein